MCDITLVVETFDNTSVYTPTTSRIAALVIIDILSTAVALRRDEQHSKRLGRMKRQLNTVRSADVEPGGDGDDRPVLGRETSDTDYGVR